MRELERRIEALESPSEGGPGPLPLVVPDSTSDAEIERLKRLHRCEVVRESEAPDVFL
jgi:hypothetical protein